MKNPIFIVLLPVILLLTCEKQDENTKPANNEISISLHYALDWQYASTPVMFPESQLHNNLLYNANRAKLAWYFISKEIADSLELTSFYSQSDFYEKISSDNKIPIFNISYYPSQRGFYNFDTKPTSYSKGIDENGMLHEPATRWGGMQREIFMASYDFDMIIPHIEFWFKNPCTNQPNVSGKLYIDIGMISEDILKDGLLADENRLRSFEPQLMDTSVFGIVGTYPNQGRNIAGNEDLDVGLDGLNDRKEREFFKHVMDKYIEICNPSAKNRILEDPSADNHIDPYTVDSENPAEIYANDNLPENNSAFPDYSDILGPRWTRANTEDILYDYALSIINSYREYVLYIDPDSMTIGHNHIVDAKILNDQEWLHVKIPFFEPFKEVGNPGHSMQYMRIFLTGFKEEVHLQLFNFKLTLRRKESENE